MASYPAPIPRRWGRRAFLVLGLGVVGAGFATWRLLSRNITYVTAPVEREPDVGGMPGRLNVPCQAVTYAPSVPGGGDVEPGLPPHVWVLREGKPVPILVNLGTQYAGRVEITGGQIKEGDEVIIAEQCHPSPNRW